MKLKLYKWIFLNKKGLYTQQKSDIHNKLIRKKRMSWRIITHPRKMKALTDLLVTLPLSSMFFFSDLLKVAFFRKCDSFFKSPNLQKKIFQKTILSLKFKFPANNTLLYFNIDLEIWNTHSTFWKKSPLGESTKIGCILRKVVTLFDNFRKKKIFWKSQLLFESILEGLKMFSFQW